MKTKLSTGEYITHLERENERLTRLIIDMALTETVRTYLDESL